MVYIFTEELPQPTSAAFRSKPFKEDKSVSALVKTRFTFCFATTLGLAFRVRLGFT